MIAVLGALLGIGMGLVFGVALMTSLRDEGSRDPHPGGQLAGFLLSRRGRGRARRGVPGPPCRTLDVLRAIATE